ncbi:MAG: hypothetical protein ACRCYU_07325 [Nocardioides sp.]
MAKSERYPRVSKYYNLQGNQATFDFVDVRTKGDTALFIDPTLLATLDSPWAHSCASSIKQYFQAVLDAIVASDSHLATSLLASLSEDNSTRLGYSARSQGSGLGTELAAAFYAELSNSQAVASGLISDIEDTALLIEGIREDRVSDVVTNVIREQLIEYTQSVAKFYDIRLVRSVAIGNIWDSRASLWVPAFADLPVPKHGGPLLLVPKAIVRRVLTCDPGDYYRYSVLPFFQKQELQFNSPLVQVLRSGERRVTKKSVEAKYRSKHSAGSDRRGVQKRINLDATSQDRALLADFKERRHATAGPESADAIADATGTALADLHKLLAGVHEADKGGGKTATQYERAVEALLNALFYPELVNPIRQEPIHNGRKRIDISYTNAANSGFFDWVGRRYPAANIVVECKNYTNELANPEYDQLSGRFSPSRGMIGLLIHRKFENKEKSLESCRDTAKDSRGYLIPIDDDDLESLVKEKEFGSAAPLDGLLRERFRFLTS